MVKALEQTTVFPMMGGLTKLSNEDQRRMFCFIYLSVGVVIVLTILHVFMWNRKKPKVESLSEV
jgi:hypothetical protein